MAAAVGTARVTFLMVVVMITLDIGAEVQFARRQCFCCCISVAGNTTIKPDTRIAQCHLGTAALSKKDICLLLVASRCPDFMLDPFRRP